MREPLPVPDMPTVDPTAVVPHFASLGALAAIMAGWLPFFVAVIPAIYYVILIIESKTVQAWLAKRRIRKRALRIAKIMAAKKVAEAKAAADRLITSAHEVAAQKVAAASVEANALVTTTAVQAEIAENAADVKVAKGS